jgi:exosortase
MNTSFRPTGKSLLIAALLAWAYLPTLSELLRRWTTDPQYSHGLLVPLFSIFLLYYRRTESVSEPRSLLWSGYAVLLVALACRAGAGLLSFLPLDALSLVLCLTGLTMVTGGRPLLQRTWRSLAFLLFMIPLPYQVERMMGAELQSIATICSTFLLQTCALPAVSEGNHILIDDVRLGVVEACSGLRMLMTFLAFCVGAVMLLDRHWLVKLLVLGSAVPIALATNVLRITATGLANVWLKDSPSKVDVLGFIHDFNGWMMMPVGLLFLMLELWIFKHLLIEPEPATT